MARDEGGLTAPEDVREIVRFIRCGCVAVVAVPVLCAALTDHVWHRADTETECCGPVFVRGGSARDVSLVGAMAVACAMLNTRLITHAPRPWLLTRPAVYGEVIRCLRARPWAGTSGDPALVGGNTLRLVALVLATPDAPDFESHKVRDGCALLVRRTVVC